MSFNTNLGQGFGGGTRERELRQTREAWDLTERAWRASPLGEATTPDLVLRLVKDFIHDLDRVPATPLLVAFCEAAADILRGENLMALEAEWDVVESDSAVAVNFRQMLARRRRWATNFERQFAIVGGRLHDGFNAIVKSLPESCFTDWEAGDRPTFDVPLIELLDRPAELIQDLIVAAYDDDTLRLDLLLPLRRAFERNLLVASGFPTSTEVTEVQERLVLPTRHRKTEARELADLYLAGTPWAAFFELPVPFAVPEAVRFEHCHIVGGTGHGKTQLMQRMIHADLAASKEDGRSVVVIDSQGDLINKLVRLDLFDPDRPASLSDRLVLVDPADIEFPVALNLFDAHLSRVAEYRPVDRERVLNGAVELYETLFGDLLGAELTQKQGVVFRYLARLMVTIPGATIHTLMRLMEDGRPFRDDMKRLDGSARYFFETEFFHPSFAATKKQILRRLWGVLSTPAFERMFAQPKNKIDLFEATRSGKVVLVSTAKDLLKSDGSALLGRFFIRMLAQAALERSALAEWERTPTYVYVDEAQEYFDEGTEAILQQARKYRIALVAAHQSLDQASPRLRSALFANTSFKCAGGVSAKDARALADEFHTSAEFIGSMKRRGERTEFAAWIKNWTAGAVRLSVPLGFLERQPTLSEELLDEVVARNRLRYCGTLDDVRQALAWRAPEPEAPEPSVRDEPTSIEAEALPSVSIPDILTSEPLFVPPVSAPAAMDAPPVAERELGKGGKKHRYLQSLVKGLAEQQGFRATIEAPIKGGQVDVLLERDGVSVAVEVSVTTPVEWERGNLRRCLAEPFSRVALVLAKSERTAKSYREAVVAGLGPDELSRLTILYPDDLPDFIGSLAEPPEPEANIVKGYRVRVTRTDVSPEEAKGRRETLARLVGESLRRQRDAEE